MEPTTEEKLTAALAREQKLITAAVVMIDDNVALRLMLSSAEARADQIYKENVDLEQEVADQARELIVKGKMIAALEDEVSKLKSVASLEKSCRECRAKEKQRPQMLIPDDEPVNVDISVTRMIDGGEIMAFFIGCVVAVGYLKMVGALG